MVASTVVTAGGTKDYLEKYMNDLVAKGIYTKIAWLTGSHGKDNGQDGMNFLECLSDANRQIDNESETRNFYVRWCYFFGLAEEGEDPRVFDPATGQVTGINTAVETPEWAGRKPGRVPGDYKNLQQLADIKIMLIDIANFHGKPEELIAVIKKFEPSTLIIDWCFTRGGYTAQQLTAAGVISRIMLENELSIITGRGWIKLSDEQKKVIDDIETMEMTGDGSHHDGSIIFLVGPYGSGKTVLGIEAGRIMRSRRQINTDKEVELTFSAPDIVADNLLNTVREKYFITEKMGNIKTIQEIYEIFQLGKYDHYKDNPLSTIAKIGQALYKSGKQHVIILDELWPTQDYAKMKKYPNVDLVFLAKASYTGERDILPPARDTTVRVHELGTSYRQGRDSFMAHKYMMTHTDKYAYLLSAAAAMVSDDGERCPPGQRTVWIECKEGVEAVTALERVKTVLDDERKRTGGTEEGDCKDHVTVVRGYGGITEAVKTYCAEQGWTCLDSMVTIHGYEDEVIFIII